MKKILALISLSVILLNSCNKKDEADGIGPGEIAMNIKVSSPEFNNDLVRNKLASNYAYNPVEEHVTDYNKDYILVSELTSVPTDYYLPKSKILAKQANTTPGTHDIDFGDVYKLLVFNTTSKELVLDLNLTSGATDNPKVLLGRNTSYTFIAYSLNTTEIGDLEDILYPQTGTKTLNNSYVEVIGNEDLLYYRHELTTPSSATGSLSIILKHKFNLLTTTIDVYASGYPINSIAANMNTPANTSRINFSSSNEEILRTSTAANLVNLSFDLSTAPLPEGMTGPAPVANSLATSNQFVYSTENGQSLLNIGTLKIGDMTNPSTIKPFRSINLQPGFQYNLSVKMVPRDSIYVTASGVPVARINGQVWMRYNLGAPVGGDNPESNINTGIYDTPGKPIHGDYYQWGQNLPLAHGDAQSKNDYLNFRDSVFYTTDNPYFHPNYMKLWNNGTNENPSKGTADPCPTGFRIPSNNEFNQLLTSVGSSSAVWSGSRSNSLSNYSVAVQLISKYNNNVRLTFPAQGFIYIEGDYYKVINPPANSPGGRGTNVYVRTAYYSQTGTHQNGIYKLISFNYSALQALNGAQFTTYTGPGSTSAPVNAHILRCVSIANNVAISLRDRVIVPDNQTVVF